MYRIFMMALGIPALTLSCAPPPAPPPAPVAPAESVRDRISLLIAPSTDRGEYAIGGEPRAEEAEEEPEEEPEEELDASLPTPAAPSASVRIADHANAPWSLPEVLGSADRLAEAIGAGSWAARAVLPGRSSHLALPVRLGSGGIFPVRYARGGAHAGRLAFLEGIVAAGALPAVMLHLDDATPESLRSLPREDIDFLRSTVLTGVRLMIVPAADLADEASGPALHRLLRRDIGFEGVIAADLSGLARGQTARAGLAAIRSGADLLLGADPSGSVAGALAAALESGELPFWRAAAAVRRVEALLQVEASADPLVHGALPSAPTRVVVQLPSRRHAGPVPLRPSQTVAILYASRDRAIAEALIDRLRPLTGLIHPLVVDRGRLGWGEQDPVRRAALSADAVLLIGSGAGAAFGSVASPDSTGAALAPAVLIAFGEDDPPALDLSALWSAQSDARVIDAVVRVLVGSEAPLPAPPDFLPGSAPRAVRTMPRRVGMSDDSLRQVDRLLQEGLAENLYTGAVLAVGRRGGLVRLRGYGALDAGGLEPVRGDTPFDLASLTKIVATTSAVMLLIDDGVMSLRSPVRRWLPEFAGPMKPQVTVRHLLEHSSGLPAGGTLWRTAESPEDALRQIMATPLRHVPGERQLYSDWGLVVLAAAVERAAGEPIDRFLERRLFRPLGMSDTGFLPSRRIHPSIAPSLRPGERPFERRGIVHDPNAFRLGGVAGHAGLFSSARDLSAFAQMILNEGSYGSRRILRPETVRRFLAHRSPDGRRALGWEVARENNSGGPALEETGAVGHTGYTGTSIWIDPERELFVILLTNRTYTGTESGPIVRLRREVNEAVVRSILE